MIVVSSSPRCGSSLCMQTLDLLGVPMAAPKFLVEHTDIREFNPNGFYEINSEQGVTDERYKGKAIKLFGAQLWRTKKELIDKLIFIDRNKEDAIKSYDKVRKHLPHSDYSSEAIYEANKIFIEKSIDEKTMKITLEKVRENPTNFVSELISYLGINPSEEQINNATKNIKTCQSQA